MHPTRQRLALGELFGLGGSSVFAVRAHTGPVFARAPGHVDSGHQAHAGPIIGHGQVFQSASSACRLPHWCIPPLLLSPSLCLSYRLSRAGSGPPLMPLVSSSTFFLLLSSLSLYPFLSCFHLSISRSFFACLVSHHPPSSAPFTHSRPSKPHSLSCCFLFTFNPIRSLPILPLSTTRRRNRWATKSFPSIAARISLRRFLPSSRETSATCPLPTSIPFV